MIRLGTLELDSPVVMGILNVTPDSFSDGGRFDLLDAALRQAESMATDGAAIIDVGGESTRPGAAAISDAEELERVIPIIEALRRKLDVPVSIDTSKPAVMRAAVAAGASMINDIYALQAEGAMAVAVELQQPVCLMHMQGQPRTMQDNPHYDDVVSEVTVFLGERVAQCREAGLGKDMIVVDPGFGFGKTPAHNVEILANLRQLLQLGCPLMIGVSRKATLGHLSGRDLDDRLPASIAAAVLAAEQGADIIRAHDVAATVDAMAVTRAVLESGNEQ